MREVNQTKPLVFLYNLVQNNKITILLFSFFCVIIRCCKDKSDNGGESEPNERTSQEKSDGGDKKEEVEEIAYH